MHISLYIANKLGLKSSGKEVASPGIWVGYIGVALAIFIMLIAVFVVNGFKKEITSKLLGFNANITLYAPDDANNPAFTSGLRFTDSLRSILSESAGQNDFSLVIRQPAVFKTNDNFQGIILKGIVPDATEWDFYSENMIEGHVPSKDDGANAVVISASTASKLGVSSGDKILTHFLDGNNIRTRNLKITGVFDSHFHEFDDAFAITPIEMLQKLNHVDSITGTAIEIRGLPLGQTQSLAASVNSALIDATVENPENPMLFKVNTIEDSCIQYLSWLDLLDTNVITIIVLMACVAGFTLVSSLFIIILERVNTIGILKAMGTTNTQVRKVFIYMAERLVLKGILIGNLLAIATAYIQYNWHIIPLDPESYYLNFVPIEISWSSVAIVDAAAIIISAMVLILPSHIIARLSPATTLRYE